MNKKIVGIVGALSVVAAIHGAQAMPSVGANSVAAVAPAPMVQKVWYHHGYYHAYYHPRFWGYGRYPRYYGGPGYYAPPVYAAPVYPAPYYGVPY